MEHKIPQILADSGFSKATSAILSDKNAPRDAEVMVAKLAGGFASFGCQPELKMGWMIHLPSRSGGNLILELREPSKW